MNHLYPFVYSRWYEGINPLIYKRKSWLEGADPLLISINWVCWKFWMLNYVEGRNCAGLWLVGWNGCVVILEWMDPSIPCTEWSKRSCCRLPFRNQLGFLCFWWSQVWHITSQLTNLYKKLENDSIRERKKEGGGSENIYIYIIIQAMEYD